MTGPQCRSGHKRVRTPHRERHRENGQVRTEYSVIRVRDHSVDLHCQLGSQKVLNYIYSLELSGTPIVHNFSKSGNVVKELLYEPYLLLRIVHQQEIRIDHGKILRIRSSEKTHYVTPKVSYNGGNWLTIDILLLHKYFIGKCNAGLLLT